VSNKINKQDFAGAANQFPRWSKANMGGYLMTLNGLIKRRYAEKNLFLKKLIE
jgi:lysozyme